jgi:hypothetical protein
MDLITTFGQHASGEFTCQTVPGTPHCGKIDGPATFSYTVDIPFSRGCDVLDAAGFLLDNLDFQRYFDNLPPIAISCENLAKQAASYFCYALGDRAVMIDYVSVRIHPFAGVWTEARVHPSKPMSCEVAA